MNNKALALLIILQAIRANRSIHPSNDVEGIGGAEASSCTLARSIDRSGRNGSFSNETQFCETWKGTKKNFGNFDLFFLNFFLLIVTFFLWGKMMIIGKKLLEEVNSFNLI